jgi:hypothetical protein
MDTCKSLKVHAHMDLRKISIEKIRPPIYHHCVSFHIRRPPMLTPPFSVEFLVFHVLTYREI